MTNTDELIVYSNSSNGLGVRILGAKQATNKSGIYIKELLPDGLAKRDGRLKIGDQILSINDKITIGINRENAVNLLRSAAATNQVRLHVRHFFPPLSSNEYQKLLFEEKTTDDDNDNDDIHRIVNHSQNRNNNNNNNNILTTNNVRMRRSSRRHRRDPSQQYRYSTYDISFQNRKDQQEKTRNNPTLNGLDVSHDALQSLLNSRFKLIDLVDLLKKTYPNLLSNDQKRESQFIQQLSQTTTDGRITLKDFERQSSVLLGERINLLSPFYSSSTHSLTKDDNQIIVELRREIGLCRSTIDELQNKILTCEKSQRLSEQVEIEYEELLKYVYEQLRQYKRNEKNHLRQLKTNDQLIQKLFNYLSMYINKPNDQHIISQLKHDYEQQQQQQFMSITHSKNSNDTPLLSNRKSYHQT